MKHGLKDIIGKQITAVVVASSPCAPRQQVFLVFADGTRFELYGENFSCCSGLDKADGIADYVESAGGKVDRVYGDASALEPARALAGGTGELMSRDLNAWRLAKAAVERARRG